jgi:hypothetical protein
MKTQTLSVPALTFAAVLLCGAGLAGAEPLGTAFTYQGQLTEAGAPATGQYDLQFTLYDAPSGGTQVGPRLSTNAVAVSEGLFTVSLDFGAGVFTGNGRWLELSVRTNGGGAGNTIQTNAYLSTIGGGYTNTVSGSYGNIPGGVMNSATNYAFAAGYRAKAIHTGSFVWGDYYFADISSAAVNSVTFRAAGGYRLFSNSGATVGASLAAGSGSWTSISDRNAKENYQPVDQLEVLEKVVALPVTSWNYKSQDPAVRHLGPTAQDFRAAFGLGETELGISSVDADGVALAAIQGLNQKLAEQLKAKDAQLSALAQDVLELKALVRSLAGQLKGGGQ